MLTKNRMRSTSEKQWNYSMTMMTMLVTTERTASGIMQVSHRWGELWLISLSIAARRT